MRNTPEPANQRRDSGDNQVCLIGPKAGLGRADLELEGSSQLCGTLLGLYLVSYACPPPLLYTLLLLHTQLGQTSPISKSRNFIYLGERKNLTIPAWAKHLPRWPPAHMSMCSIWKSALLPDRCNPKSGHSSGFSCTRSRPSTCPWHKQLTHSSQCRP